MTLFINGNNLTNPFWGVSRVAFELIRSLDNILGEKGRLDPFGEVILLGRNPTAPLMGLRVISYEHIKAPGVHLWENVALTWRTGRDPILGFQNRNPVFKRNCATMIHGLQVLTQPKSYSKRAAIEGRIFLPLIGRRHRTILTVSDFSASEIAEIGIAPRGRIKIVHNGLDHKETRPRGVGQTVAIPPLSPRSYVVAQSSVKPHKNIATLLRAFADPALSHLKLVLFGGDNENSFREAGMVAPANVMFTGMIGDEALSTLLQNSLCLAFPSLTEGFGLPPLEAMKMGIPAIVSDRGAIPEVCADAAIMLDPTRPDEWSSAILRLEHNASVWEHYAKAGYEHAAQFTWERAGRQLYEILRDRHGNT